MKRKVRRELIYKNQTLEGTPEMSLRNEKQPTGSPV
jgi:hypothetical protein